MRLIFTFILTLLALPAFAADFQLNQSKEGVHLKTNNQALSTILQEIGQKSGIAFYMKEEMYGTPVTTEIKAVDWKSLVSQLLQDFSKIEMWSEDIAGSKIRITGLGQYVPPAPGTVVQPKGPQIITSPKTAPSRSAAIPKQRKYKRPEPPQKAEEIHPNHPLAKLPSHVFMEPAIMNYLLENNVDIPDAFKKKYGLPTGNEDDRMGAFTQRRSLPIPNEIYNDPKFDEYLKSVGLSKPPQIPPGFKKLKPGERP